MAMTFRNHILLGDFETVSEFLRENYTKHVQNGTIPQLYLEYAHTHPFFHQKITHRFGIWEENEQIASVACYEMRLGESFMLTKFGYEHMKPMMLEYSERELSKFLMMKREVWMS